MRPRYYILRRQDFQVLILEENLVFYKGFARRMRKEKRPLLMPLWIRGRIISLFFGDCRMDAYEQPGS